MADDFLPRLQAQCALLEAELKTMREAAHAAGREHMNRPEKRAYEELQKLRAHIELVTRDEKRLDAINNNLSRFSPTTQQRATDPNPQNSQQRQPMKPNTDYHLTYSRHDSRGKSWMRDLAMVSINQDHSGECRNRLQQHSQEVAQDPLYNNFPEHRDLSRTDGQGGYAVPPAWLMDQYVELARPGRPFANIVKRQQLPSGTDSINVPKVLTGTSVAVQTADNATVSNTDLTDTFINSPVRTLSGQQSVAIQLLQQSPVAFDDIIFADLIADHATQIDTQVLSGNGTNGQVLGVNYTPGINTVPVSELTIQGIYSALANAIQTVHTTRFLPPEVIVCHPRRWGWFQSLLDTADRPLFLPNANGPWNAAGIQTAVASQGVVGQMFGLPVIVDANISCTNGPFSPSGNEDLLYLARVSDIVLWESPIQARVLPEPKASTLTVVLQVFNYFAFSAARYPESIAVIEGLTAPTF